uniref:Mirror-image polydactyly 1 n=1 Tax=Gasterosteus aculeatus aculeatus TaxID=481459 RepID=A0AAQ4S0B0_GASAC
MKFAHLLVSLTPFPLVPLSSSLLVYFTTHLLVCLYTCLLISLTSCLHDSCLLDYLSPYLPLSLTPCLLDSSALLEEVLAAQQGRGRAVMSRLLLANKERDEAFIRARQVQLAAEHLDVSLEDPDEDTAEDMDQLLCCVCDADSVQKVQRFGSVLVQHLRLARQRRNEITTQEMMAVMKERDSAIAKCKQLEQDVMEERKEHARETELLRRKDIDVELQVLQAPRSFQDLHAPLPSDGGSPLALVQQLSNEKENMGAELQRCREAEREASEKVLKLERLVEVLRKKVGTGSLRAVM